MNDSFLEDLGLVPQEKEANSNQLLSNRYITTRQTLSGSPKIRTKNNVDDLTSKQEKIISSSSPVVPKIKVSEPKPLTSTPKGDEKRKSSDSVIKSMENKRRSDELKMKSCDMKILSKLPDKHILKDRSRRSGSTGRSNRLSDPSSKENTRPFTDTSSSRDSGSHPDESKKDPVRRISDGTSKKSDVMDKIDPVMFLSAIKDLVSRYTEQETIKITRLMQSLHINSQATLIKQLMFQTDELLSDRKDNASIKNMIEENQRLKEEVFILHSRNEVLQKRVEELQMYREENISLKLKIKELQNQ